MLYLYPGSLLILHWIIKYHLRADYMSQRMTLTRGKECLTRGYRPKNIDLHELIKKVADKCLCIAPLYCRN